jgi:hypothetical protein
MCKIQGERAGKREPDIRMNVERGGKNTMGKSREKYHMVSGIVPYGIGIVPYGIWYRTIQYWASRWKDCMYV